MLGEGEWVDAQPFLAAVCAGMGVGELLHDATFSMHDSCYALEIGDVKMDMGFSRNKDLGTVEELIAGGAAPASLPPRQLLAVMDRLLTLEASWHSGSLLPQTVFTSLYMLRPDRLAANAPLHAFCVALRSTCTIVVDMVHAGSVTEHEDLLVDTCGIKSLDPPGDKPIKAALQALAAAEEQLEQQVASGGSTITGGADSSGGNGGMKSGAGKGGGGQGGSLQQGQGHQQQAVVVEGEGAAASSAAAGELALSGADAAALLARIRFRRLLLEALQALKQYNQAAVEQGRRLCQLADAQLALVLESAELAVPLDQAPGFQAELNNRNMDQVPPRPLLPCSMQQAVEHWQRLLRGMADTLHSLLFVRGSWPALKATLVAFASRNHHAIVRSVMHLQLIKPLPPPPPPDGAADSAAKLVKLNFNGSGGGTGGGGGGKKPAAEIPPWCPSQQMVCHEFGLSLGSVPSTDAALFVEQATVAVQGQVFALCLNRCRQRRRMRRQLEDWRNIFDHGFNADVTVPMQRWLGGAGWRWVQQEGLLQGQGPAATWAERESAACALMHLQLGFPLDLYAPYEHLQIYWYSQYLLQWQQRLTILLHGAAPPPALPPPKRGSAGAGGRGRGGRGGGVSAAQRGAEEQAAAAGELKMLLLDVERMMCQGMVHSAMALQQLGCVAAPSTPFNNEEQRYEQRFACMEMLFRPEPAPYEHFREATDATGLPPARLLGLAAASFQRAAERAAALLAAPPLRTLLREEQVRHLEGVQRTATQNGVACKLLAATSVKAAAEAAAAATGAAGGEQGQGPPPPALAPKLPFQVSFDFKTALAHSTAQFYPAIVLRH